MAKGGGRKAASPSRGAKTPRRDVYQEVTDRIVGLLDAGTAPWKHPLKAGAGGDGLPRNLASGKAYRGVNVFLLAMTQWAAGYESPHWTTFRQAKERGGTVKKGERGTPVIFWKLWEKEDEKTGDIERIPTLKRYTVFNAAAQCEGLELPSPPPESDAEPFEPIPTCEAIAAGFPDGPTVTVEGARPRYRPSADTVFMPEAGRFVSPEEYYATLFHELGHATGAEKRLHRGIEDSSGPFGGSAYGKEELVAEMAAAFLCAAGGIGPATVENSAAYLQGWAKTLKGDKRLVVNAAAAGQKAADWVRGIKPGDWETNAPKAPAKASAEPTPEPPASAEGPDLSEPEPAREAPVPVKRERPEIVVAAERMEPGAWSSDLTKRIGQGDVRASYSGDVIVEGRVRTPFTLAGVFRVSVGSSFEEGGYARTYRLVPAGDFCGEAVAYRDRTEEDHAAARDRPLGFYHGLAVKRGTRAFVLAGPETVVRGSAEPPGFQRELL